MKKESVKLLVEHFGRRYPEILGINLSNRNDEEIFKWFLASILFGAPITENSAIKTFNCFKKYDILTPEKILATEWEGLVKILDEGSCTRYDFKTADKLLEVTKNLIERYNGSLTALYSGVSDEQELQNKLKSLGKGIGDVTVSIFLREMRDIWKKAKPKPTSLVVLAAKKLGIVQEKTAESITAQLKNFWSRNRVTNESFVNFETALLKLGKDYCRKKKCASCMFKSDCLLPEAL